MAGMFRTAVLTVSASTDERISARLGQISRLNGSMDDLFSALDKGDCDFILTTDAAVFYKNFR